MRPGRRQRIVPALARSLVGVGPRLLGVGDGRSVVVTRDGGRSWRRAAVR
jgi:hypothetical protein